MPQQIDQLIHARWVVPVVPDCEPLAHHSVAVDRGRILDLLPSNGCGERYEARQQTTLGSHVLIPGLVNAHTHAAMSLFRGLADDLPLMEWLNQHIWPAEERWVDEEFVRLGTRLAIVEMLRSGTTCFNDMYFFPDVVADAAEAMDIRASVGLIVLDFPTAWARDAGDYLRKGTELHDALKESALVTTAFAPHAPYTVSDEPLRKLRVLADELDLPVHMHVHETAHEVNEAAGRSGIRPLERLSQLDLLNNRLLAVHMTQLLPAEIEAVAAAGAHVVHCPEAGQRPVPRGRPDRRRGQCRPRHRRRGEQQRSGHARRDAQRRAAGQGRERRAHCGARAYRPGNGYHQRRPGAGPGRAHRLHHPRQSRRPDRRGPRSPGHHPGV